MRMHVNTSDQTYAITSGSILFHSVPFAFPVLYFPPPTACTNSTILYRCNDLVVSSSCTRLKAGSLAGLEYLTDVRT